MDTDEAAATVLAAIPATKTSRKNTSFMSEKVPCALRYHPSRRALRHECLDLRDLARHLAHTLEPLRRDDVAVLDAYAGVLVLRDRRLYLRDECAVARRVGQHLERRSADVDARLDRECIADFER